MKLLIQIPCYNEEKTLSNVLEDIPKSIPGIDTIETQIIDDGSTDKTVEIAKLYNVDYIISYIGNKGLGNAFKKGIENALKVNADILVNTDGDNQYKSTDIPKLIKPILDNKADIVIGNRQTDKIQHFSKMKKFLQKLGSKTTQLLAGIKVKDAVSGFRAYSNNALLELNITSDYSYVLDTTIQAGKKGITIDYVNIETNPPTRPSRLFNTMWGHIKKSTANMVRVYTMYEPFKIFLTLGIISLFIGIYPITRFLYFYFINQHSGHTQSLLLGTMFVIIAFQFFGLAIVADLLNKQRKLTEDILLKLKKR